MTHDHSPSSWQSDRDLTTDLTDLTTDLATVAMDHVRLSYCYLDDGDVDGYCSLFAEQAVLRQPGRSPVTGRQELERFERARQATRPVRHSIDEIFGSGRRVAAIGRRSRRCTSTGTESDVHFVDVFTVADNGLLVDRTTFLFTPSGHPMADKRQCRGEK